MDRPGEGAALLRHALSRVDEKSTIAVEQECAISPPRRSLCLTVRKGAAVVYDGRAAKVLAICSPSRILVRVEGTGKEVWVAAGQLSGCASAVPRIRALRTDAPALDTDELKRANLWLDLLRQNISNFDLPRSARQAVAKAMGVSVRTVVRHLAIYLDDPSAIAQARPRPGPDKGSSYLGSARRAIITAAIEEVHETAERGSIKATTDRARQLSKAAGFKLPSYCTVRRQILARDRWAAARKRHGRVRGDAMAAPAGKSLIATRPLSFVQIDSAIVDLIVVDPVTREEIGRPWITIAVDVASRCVLGFYLSFDPPSQTSVALTLENACCPKDEWLRQIGFEGDWLPFGLIACVGWDNAKYFRVNSLVQACLAAGIRTMFRQVRHPTHGVYIERYIGSFMGQIHLLKGTTFSTPKAKEDYKSQKRAVMSLPELTLWAVHQINGVYHNQEHSSLGITPIEYWTKAFSTSNGYEIPTYPADRRTFRLSLLPGVYRPVTREGVARFSLHYWDDALVPLIKNGERYWVAHDPRDISRVYLRLGDSYLDIPWRDRTERPVALFEWEHAKAILKAEHDAPASEARVFEHLAAMRKIEQTAERTTRNERRDRARRPADTRPAITPPAARVDYSQPSVVLSDPLLTP